MDLATQTCPHGGPMGACTAVWCRSRLEDAGQHSYPPIERPETVEEALSAVPANSGRRRGPKPVDVSGRGAPDLIRHMRIHYSDFHIKHDLDAVLDACESAGDREIVLMYAKARRKTPGFNPRSYEPGKRHNSHQEIPASALLVIDRAIEESRQAEEVRQAHNRTCETCGEHFTAKRLTARFCSSRCRISAHRAA